MENLNNFCNYVLSKYCCEEFLINFNLLNVVCLKAALSKALGIAIVAGSILVKVPQIIKILGAKSAEGISLFGTSLELCAMLANVSYNFVNQYPFSSYGDGLFLLIQTSIIGALVLHYGGSTSQAIMFLLTISSIFVTLCSSITPLSVLWFLQASNIPIVFFGKMIQGWANYQNKSTGQLSAITIVMLFFGTTARIFTSIQETGDPIIIITYSVATLANGILFAQLIMYWNNVPVSKHIQKKKKL